MKKYLPRKYRIYGMIYSYLKIILINHIEFQKLTLYDIIQV
jgi:hypothetical protein